VISTLTWTLPRPAKSKYKGAFPLHFEENLVKLLGYPERILHPFGGMAETGVRVDLNPTLQPDVIADAHDLPFHDQSFDLVLLDPPYSDEEALELYETPKLRPAAYTREAVRVCREGGWVVVYARPVGLGPRARAGVVRERVPDHDPGRGDR
jgi:hypothetical protein